MPEIEEMEWIPIADEVLKDRFRGLRLFLTRVFWLLRCDPEYFPSFEDEEDVIEF